MSSILEWHMCSSYIIAKFVYPIAVVETIRDFNRSEIETGDIN
jgi:hypothetical protein